MSKGFGVDCFNQATFCQYLWPVLPPIKELHSAVSEQTEPLLNTSTAPISRGGGGAGNLQWSKTGTTATTVIQRARESTLRNSYPLFFIFVPLIHSVVLMDATNYLSGNIWKNLLAPSNITGIQTFLPKYVTIKYFHCYTWCQFEAHFCQKHRVIQWAIPYKRQPLILRYSKSRAPYRLPQLQLEF